MHRAASLVPASIVYNWTTVVFLIFSLTKISLGHYGYLTSLGIELIPYAQNFEDILL
jgi:hypothetical protein